ncbi:O-antigen ligase family protein [Streptomyces sp. NPDC057616]|uniref:O-antigen ligase family protein n=1 Tax=Streptomyces sp. NPDC057616 TaxID=3346183 RepID=UPI0036915C7C
MSLGEIWAILRRRWYFMVPFTVLSLIGGGYLWVTVPVSYESHSSVALLDSSAVARLAPTFGNPISNAGGSLIVTADVLIRTLESADAAKELRSRGVTDTYTAGFAPASDSPLLVLSVTGTDRDKVLKETNTLTAFAGEQLNALQEAAKVPPAYAVQTAPVVLPQTPVAKSKGRYQGVAAVLILGVVSAFLLSILMEGVSVVRRRYREAPRPKKVRTPKRIRAPKRSRAGMFSRRVDATAVLTVYLVLAFFIPSNLALPALGGVGTPANVFALLGLMWYLATWLGGRILPAPGTRLVRVSLCVLGLAVLAAYISDAMRESSHQEVLGADRGLIGYLVWVSLVVLTSAAMQQRGRLDVLMRRVVIMASVVAAIGFYDFFAATNIADSIHIPGLQTSVAQVSVMDRGAFTRPRATTAQPLEFAGMLAILLPFAVQQAFDPVRRHLHVLRRWGPVILMAGALPLSVSRTSIIGLLLVALVMVPRWKPARRWAAIGVLTASVAVFKVLVPGLIGTITGLFASFLSNSDSSTQARTVKYSAIVPYLKEHPLFGRGFGTFTPDLYFFTDNQYMLGLAEMGLLGLVALFVLFITGIHQGGAIRRLARTDADRELGQAFFASALVAMVSSATFDSLSFPMFAGMFFLMLGAGASYLGFIRREAAAAGVPGPRTTPEAELPQLVESR